ncbi:alanine-glyoxylate transaminase [Haematococcus lacustris]
MVLSKLVWGLTRQARKLSSAQDACLATLPLRAMSSAPAPVEERPLPELPGFAYTPKQYAGPSAAEVLAIRKKYLSPSLFHHFRKPVMIVEGKAQYLFDETGRRYLDAFAGIVTVSVGHCHPEVVKAVNQQSEILQHTTTIYLNHQIAEYAKELADKMPGNLKCVYFVNSGSEANDMAMMLARTFTGNWDLIGLRNAYHGMSIATMGTCGQHTWKQPMPQGFGIHHALNPDPYRGVFGNDGPAYARDVQDLIQSATSGKVAGFMAETIQGVGGATPLAAGYLPEVYKMVRAAGGITIADEVQTGFGRTGSAYWGFQNQGVLPDIVTMAKGMGNGLPLAAVVTTPEIAASMASRLHFNTFGGNPVCSAGGRAVLRVIDTEQLQANCARVGQHLVARLQQLAQKHSIIGDVRGQGLMLGVEFVKDKATKEPASKEVVEVMERMKDMGVLMGKGGIYGNVFRIKPPMCFNIADAEFLVDVMDRAITDGL